MGQGLRWWKTHTSSRVELGWKDTFFQQSIRTESIFSLTWHQTRWFSHIFSFFFSPWKKMYLHRAVSSWAWFCFPRCVASRLNRSRSLILSQRGRPGGLLYPSTPSAESHPGFSSLISCWVPSFQDLIFLKVSVFLTNSRLANLLPLYLPDISLSPSLSHTHTHAHTIFLSSHILLPWWRVQWSRKQMQEVTDNTSICPISNKKITSTSGDHSCRTANSAKSPAPRLSDLIRTTGAANAQPVPAFLAHAGQVPKLTDNERCKTISSFD